MLLFPKVQQCLLKEDFNVSSHDNSVKVPCSPTVKSLGISEVLMLNRFFIQLFTFAVTEKYWRNCYERVLPRNDVVPHDWIQCNTVSKEKWIVFSTFSTACSVVRWRSRCGGFMDSFLRTTPHASTYPAVLGSLSQILQFCLIYCPPVRTSLPNSARFEQRSQCFFSHS